MIIAIDFDGTCVTHDYPDIGKEIGAAPVIKYLNDSGHKIILNTMRGTKNIGEAVSWFNQHNISLYGVNKNPGQYRWTDSKKIYANLYIDDSGLGIPLIHSMIHGDYVDWIGVVDILCNSGIIKQEDRDILVKQIKLDTIML